MTSTGAIIFAGIVAFCAWFAADYIRPDIGETWFIGTGTWNDVKIHGREVVAAVAGLVAWVVGLHLARA